MSLFSFQGRVSLANRLPSGRPGPFVPVGNVPTCQLALAVESTTKTESMTGKRLSFGRITTANNATLTLSFDEWLRQNLAVGFYAAPLAVTAGTVTAEPFPAGLVGDDTVMLRQPGVSGLVLTDSATPPVTVPSSKYSLISPGNGMVKIADPTGLTQPFKAAYSYSSGVSLSLFTAPSPERYFLLEGINTETGNAVRVELFRVRFDPFSQVDLINEGYGSLPVTGAVLYDPLNDNEEELGGFGHIWSVDG